MTTSDAARKALAVLGLALSGCAASPAMPPSAVISAPAAGGGPEFPGASELGSAVRHAQSQRSSGDLEGAIRTLSQLMLVAPDDPRVLGEYGKTLVSKGRAGDALAFLEQALELQPNDWMLYSAQGIALDQRGDHTAAQAAYARALALSPGEPTVLSNAGLSHMQAGDIAAAESLLLQAAENGVHPRIAQNLALVQRLRAHRVESAAHARATTAQAPTPADVSTPAEPQAYSGPSSAIAVLAADPTVVMAPIPTPEADERRRAEPAASVPAAEATAPVGEEDPQRDVPLRLRRAQ